MSNADRIEELRNKYEENPRRYFAPLANEYRKAGDLAQAIAICREHLPKQPGHMSGYIVFGQTLFEANNLEEARTVFEQALTLDPENLIALKHLGDIARMNGENGVARRWYARVLDADPRNDDIASQLASLGAPTPVVAVPVIPPPPAYSEPPLDEAVGVFASFDPSSLLDVPEDVAGIAGAREFWTPAETQPATRHEPLDLDFPESPEPQAEAEGDFEEGLIAPEWPDTTELVSRIVTPLRSATPISVPATPDAVQAFGRELTDEVDAVVADAQPQDELVDAFLPPEAVTSSFAPPAAFLPEAQTPAMDAELVEFAASEFEAVAFESGPSEFENVAFENVPSEFEPVAFEGAQIDEPEAVQELQVVRAFSEPLSVATPEPFAEVDGMENFGAQTDSDNNGLVLSDATSLLDASLDATSLPDASLDAGLPTHEWAEPESVPASAIEDFAFVSELPWDANESNSAELTDTAEYEIPAREASGAFAAVEPASWPEAVAADSAGSATEESFAEIPSHESFSAPIGGELFAEIPSDESFGAPTVEESFAEISSDAPLSAPIGDELFADVLSDAAVVAYASDETVTVVASEESFAEISSELQSERDASDHDAEVLDAIEHEATSAQANAEVAALIDATATSYESEKAQPFVTETMAELLVSQGFNSRAIEVYDELVRRRPHDPVLVARLAELREIEAAEAAQNESMVNTPTARFNTPLRNTPLRNTPLSITPLRNTPLRNTPLSATPQFSASVHNTPAYVTPLYSTPLHNTPLHNTPLHNTPLYNTPVAGTPALVPALDDSVSTQSNLSERHANDRLQAFRTARERFAELSRRRVARRTPTHATAIAEDATDGLSSLFGTTAPTTTDELAARALADAFGPVQDSGESLFDPAPTPTPAMPLRSLTPRSNSVIPTVAAESRAELRSDRQPSADYSFDKFFPDPAMASREAQSSPTAVSSTPSSTQPVNEDLAQFSAWLKGLNNA